MHWKTSPRSLTQIALFALIAVPTLVYTGMLVWYPRRDLLILWPRDFSVSGTTIACIALATLVYSLVAWRIVHAQKVSPAAAMMLILAGGLALQLAVAAVPYPDPIVEIMRRTFAWKTGGYWSVGAGVKDLRDFIGNYAQRAPLYPVHQSRHPPGLSLIFTLGTWLFARVPGLAAPVAAWLRPTSCQSLVSLSTPDTQVASGLFGALAEMALAYAPILPLYALVRRLANQRAGLWAALLYALTPGFTQWVSQFDRGLALATALGLYFSERMLAGHKRRYAFLIGLTLSVATFMTFGAVPIGLIVAVYVVARLLTVEMAETTETGHATAYDLLASRVARLGGQVPFLAQCTALALVGLGVVWGIAFVTTGLNPRTLYTAVFDSHYSIDFPFWPFVVWHPWDMLTMIGLPIALIAIFAAWRKAPVLAAAFVVPVVILSLAHVARGETGRVWLYFTPVAVGAAAMMLADQTRAFQAFTIGLLGLQLVTQGSLIRTHEYGYYPDALPAARVPGDATAVDTRFGASGQIALLAYKLSPLTPGHEQPITLWWQRMSEAPIDSAYKAFIHVAADESDQARIAQQDEMPVRSLYPTTCWAKGQIVQDVHRVPVEPDARPGDYPVFIGLYDPVAGTRPPTFASLPSKQMYGSVLVPTKASVKAR